MSGAVSTTTQPSGTRKSRRKTRRKSFTRSKSGCFTCRLRRKKCDEDRPTCKNCTNLGVTCDYIQPDWWVSVDHQRIHRDQIKTRIRQTKDNDKRKALQDFMDRHLPKPVTVEYDFNQPVVAGPSNSQYDYSDPVVAGASNSHYATNQPTPTLTQGHQNDPYEINIHTEYRTNLNNAHASGNWGLQQPTETLRDLSGHFGGVEYLQQLDFQPEPQLQLQLQAQAQTQLQSQPQAQLQLQSPQPQRPAQLQSLLQLQPQPQAQPQFQAIRPQLQSPQSQPQAQAQLQPQVEAETEAQGHNYNTLGKRVTEYINKPLSSYLQYANTVDEHERSLLRHFVDNVLRLVFPVLDLHHRGPIRGREILHSLETNKSYYHCCLSVAATHLKASKIHGADDHDIVQHRYESVSHLSKTLHSDNEHRKVLDATLAMVFFQSSVGPPEDPLPDIPWNDHFQAASKLIQKLELTETDPNTCPPFSMSLASWIDILGSTMLRATPQFSHTYRTKHLNGISSGLQEMMGCDDRIMYLISEIACLDSLMTEGHIDDAALNYHISALGLQLDHTEPVNFTLENPYSTSGAVNTEILTRNMSSVFRNAARIYLYSILPEFDRSHISTISLVTAITETLRFIPMGPYGFDRSLVWPLLITGAFSTPSSSFRAMLSQRATALGDLANFGNFGRMHRLLKEVWKLADDPSSFLETNILLTSPALKYECSTAPSTQGEKLGRSIKKQKVHWRDVMNRKGWRYLLI